MSKLEALIKQFDQAINRLDEVLKIEKSGIIRDSGIKRFEFSFDLSWKLMKEFLSEHHKIICVSPKTCFREAYKQGIIDYDDFWIKMADARNLTAHLYKEEMADDVYDNILPKALESFQHLLKQVQK